jgi:hypothetical protein
VIPVMANIRDSLVRRHRAAVQEVSANRLNTSMTWVSFDQ